MVVALNHTIVHAEDPARSAASLAAVLGLPEPIRFSHFHVVTVDNGVSLDFMETDVDYTPQHYAFLLTESEFDEVFSRITERDITYFADPGGRHVNQISHNDGGRSFYWTDESTHWYEVLTRPYGSGS